MCVPAKCKIKSSITFWQVDGKTRRGKSWENFGGTGSAADEEGVEEGRAVEDLADGFDLRSGAAQ